MSKWLDWSRWGLTSAHDETRSRVLGVDRPRHVGVVGPAQVQVKVTVGLRDTQRRMSREGESLCFLTVNTLIHRLIGGFTADVRRDFKRRSRWAVFNESCHMES